MAQRTKAYFIAKFIANYVVQHQDMQDLAESALFYTDDVGYDYYLKCLISPDIPLTVIDLASMQILKLPNISNQNPTTLIATNNLLTSFDFLDNFVMLEDLRLGQNHLSTFNYIGAGNNLLYLDLDDNLFSSFTLPFAFVHLQFFHIKYNALTSLGISDACVALSDFACTGNQLTSILLYDTMTNLVTLDLRFNFITDFTSHLEWTSIIAVDLHDNALTTLGIEHTLVGLAATGQPVTVNVDAGTNASHATWTPAALAAEITIVANGGTVVSNP